MKKGDLIAVYGTLRRGERADLHSSQKSFEAQFLCDDRITGEIFNLGSYPGFKPFKEGGFDGNAVFTVDRFEGELPAVVVEVFKIKDDSLVTILDHYEGYPYLYDRCEVMTEKGHKVWAYTYNSQCKSDDLIPSGDWKARTSSEKEAA